MSFSYLNKSDIGIVNELRLKYDIITVDYDPTRIELLSDKENRGKYAAEILGSRNNQQYNVLFTGLNFSCDLNLIYSPGMMVAETLDLLPITNFNINKENNRNMIANTAFLGETVGYNLYEHLIQIGFLPAYLNTIIDPGVVFNPPDWYFLIENQNPRQIRSCFAEAKASINENDDYRYSSDSISEDFVKNYLKQRVKSGLVSIFKGFEVVGLPSNDPIQRNEILFLVSEIRLI